MKQESLFDIGPGKKKKKSPVKKRRAFVGRCIASFYSAIVPVPKWEDGRPIEGKRYQILQTTDGILFLYDKEANIGKGMIRTYGDIEEAISDFQKIER